VTAVLFVCLGNICRSPTAHGVFQAKVTAAGWQDRIRVDSCGTSGWHVGDSPDRRSAEAASVAGYDLSALRARQFHAADFEHFDYILAMDEQNLADLDTMRPSDFNGHLGLFLNFHPEAVVREVPDPYYGAGDGFQRVLAMIEQASDGLLREVMGVHSSR